MPARTVLVVDPAPVTANRVEQALAGTGFASAVATNGSDAERVIEASDLAAVLVAVSFPKGNGYDLARQVHARHPDAAVFLLCGGFEVYNAARAAEAGVAGRINKPFTVEALRRHLESVFGPLATEAAVAEDVERIHTYEGVIEPEPASLPPAPTPTPAPAPLRPVPAEPAVADERIASFLPRDFRGHPPVRLDPEVVSPAVERAILEILPQVVDAILFKALATSPAFKDMVEVAVEEAVRAHIHGIARKVIRERLLEIEREGGG